MSELDLQPNCRISHLHPVPYPHEPSLTDEALFVEFEQRLQLTLNVIEVLLPKIEGTQLSCCVCYDTLHYQE